MASKKQKPIPVEQVLTWAILRHACSHTIERIRRRSKGKSLRQIWRTLPPEDLYWWLYWLLREGNDCLDIDLLMDIREAVTSLDPTAMSSTHVPFFAARAVLGPNTLRTLFPFEVWEEAMRIALEEQ